MRFFISAILFSLSIGPLWCQKLVAGTNSPHNICSFSSLNNRSGRATTFMGGQPFWPYLVRKIPIGHPEGAIGMGLLQQYGANPHPYRWQNEQWMQPVRGLPQYPYFVLNDFSPAISRFKNQQKMQSFSVGLINNNGINLQYREVRWVKGFPINK